MNSLAFSVTVPLSNRVHLRHETPLNQRRTRMTVTPARRVAAPAAPAAPSVPEAPDHAQLPPRVVLDPLPRLLVHDHCPLCMRVRYVLGMKNVKHELVGLMYDDFTTPGRLRERQGQTAATVKDEANKEGRVPLLQPFGDEDSAIMLGSDPILAAVDADPRYGPLNRFAPLSDRAELHALLDDMTGPSRRLTRPRVLMSPMIPEFTFAESRAIYEARHPLSDPASFADNFARSNEWIEIVSGYLEKLEPLIHSKEHVSPGGLSYDDVILFPKLRALTCVKGIDMPHKVREYLDFQAMQSDMPLYDLMAI